MKTSKILLLCVAVICSTLNAGQDNTISAQEYAQRRASIIARLDSTSVAIFSAAEESIRNDDVAYPFHQNSTFYYLTSIKDPRSVLLLLGHPFAISESLNVQAILFLPHSMGRWSQPLPSLEERAKQAGCTSPLEIALDIDSLQSVLNSVLPTVRTLYYTPSLPESFIDRVAQVSYLSWREAKKQLQERFPNLDVQNSVPLVESMRVIKSADEQKLIQKAVDRTISSLTNAMKQCNSGMYEYELKANIDYSMAKAGIEFQAFPAIVAAGKNTVYPHYSGRASRLKNGELVLIDCGAEVEGYSADITRTIPVNGKFTAAQKTLYELVLEARDSGIAAIEPGEQFATIQQTMERVLARGLQKLGILLSPDDISNYTLHSFVHFIGLDVHDVGSYTQPLEPGMVLAIEPAIYISDTTQCAPQYRGLGIRIEDDVLVTGLGCSLLSGISPVTVEEIETVMRKIPQSQPKQ